MKKTKPSKYLFRRMILQKTCSLFKFVPFSFHILTHLCFQQHVKEPSFWREQTKSRKNCNHREQIIISQPLFLGTFLHAPSERCCWHCYTLSHLPLTSKLLLSSPTSPSWGSFNSIFPTPIGFKKENKLYPAFFSLQSHEATDHLLGKRLMGLCIFFSSVDDWGVIRLKQAL